MVEPVLGPDLAAWPVLVTGPRGLAGAHGDPYRVLDVVGLHQAVQEAAVSAADVEHTVRAHGVCRLGVVIELPDLSRVECVALLPHTVGKDELGPQDQPVEVTQEIVLMKDRLRRCALVGGSRLRFVSHSAHQSISATKVSRPAQTIAPGNWVRRQNLRPHTGPRSATRSIGGEPDHERGSALRSCAHFEQRAHPGRPTGLRPDAQDQGEGPDLLPATQTPSGTECPIGGAGSCWVVLSSQVSTVCLIAVLRVGSCSSVR